MCYQYEENKERRMHSRSLLHIQGNGPTPIVGHEYIEYIVCITFLCSASRLDLVKSFSKSINSLGFVYVSTASKPIILLRTDSFLGNFLAWNMITNDLVEHLCVNSTWLKDPHSTVWSTTIAIRSCTTRTSTKPHRLWMNWIIGRVFPNELSKIGESLDFLHYDGNFVFLNNILIFLNEYGKNEKKKQLIWLLLLNGEN